jgi:uracil-DNA glycosylase family 4
VSAKPIVRKYKRQLGSETGRHLAFACDGVLASVWAVSRPIDLLLDFLRSEEQQGVTHVYLDEGARDGLRDLFLRSRETAAPATRSGISERPPAPVGGGQDVRKSSPVPPPPGRPLALVEGSKAERLAELRRQAEQWHAARALGTLRETLVFSEGNPDARLMLMGEAPTYEDERCGRPFSGPAGQKLGEILKAMGLSRDETYISYMVKFRPAMPNQSINNRKASAEEIQAFLPLMLAEIEVVKPVCMVSLGAGPAEGLLGIRGAVPELRATWHDCAGTPLRVTYPPGHLLQSTGGSQVKRLLWEDMLAVMERLGLPISAKQRSYFLPKA